MTQTHAQISTLFCNTLHFTDNTTISFPKIKLFNRPKKAPNKCTQQKHRTKIGKVTNLRLLQRLR